MASSELKAEKSSKKRKLSEVENQPEVADGAVAQKKAKKDKTPSGDKKEKKSKDKKHNRDKDGKKSRKQVKAEEAEALNAAEYDVEDKAIEAPVKAEVEEEEEKEKEKVSKKDKKEKKSKKEKKGKASKSGSIKEEKTTGDAAAGAEPAEVNGDKEKKRSKKDKKDKKARTAEPSGAKQGDGQQMKDAEAVDETDDKLAKNSRFICFIGNLPYTATSADIQTHFSSVHPSSVRLLTERDNPSKSRGIAFVEFDHFSHMKTCLSKFHHTDFTDGKGNSRRINVELTAGGGGKNDARMDKVKEKNKKLNEERARRIAKEELEKAEAAKARDKEENAKARGNKEKLEDNREEHFVHPSRRAHVPGRRS